MAVQLVIDISQYALIAVLGICVLQIATGRWK